MKLSVQDLRVAPSRCDLLVVLAPQEKPQRVPASVKIPALARTAFQGEFRETRLTDCLGGPAARFLQVGLGKPQEVDHERLRRAAAIAVRKAEKVRAKTAALWIDAEVAEL